MKLRYVNPEVDGVHPLRLELSDDEMADIMEGISQGADWMTLEEIEAAHDYLFDFIVAEKQNVEGVTTVQ
jgi:hypothetical protein